VGATFTREKILAFLGKQWENKTFLVLKLQWWRNSENVRVAFVNGQEHWLSI